MKLKIKESNIRKFELTVFDVFIKRALAIVEQDDRAADACRLVDTALRAERGDTETETQKSGGGMFLVHLARGWDKDDAAKGGQP